MIDTKSLMQWGLVVVGSVMGIAVIMLGAEAIVHDGEVATTITQQLIAVLVWGMPVIGGVLSLHQVASAYVAVKQASAQQQTAQTQAVVAAASVPTVPSNIDPNFGVNVAVPTSTTQNGTLTTVPVIQSMLHTGVGDGSVNN